MLSTIPSTSIRSILCDNRSTIFSSATPLIYIKATVVEEYLPTSKVFTTRSGDFMRLRTRDILVFISSIKPSRGPFITDEVGGSPIARAAGFRKEKIYALSSPSIKNATSQEATLCGESLISTISISSAYATVFCND